MKRIAVIDDEPAFLRGACIALERAGYEVVTLDEPHELTVLREKKPDLIVIDVNMEGVFGDEVCNALRYKGRVTAPIFLWSAIDEETLRDRADAAAASGYVCKDWGFDALVTRVQATLEASWI